jgi:hypothetical protein
MTLLTDAGNLLRDRLYQHVEAADDLADRSLPWSEDHIDAVCKVIENMSLVIRCAVHDHIPSDFDSCTTCRTPWPCVTITEIHKVLTDPSTAFDFDTSGPLG